MRGGSSSAASQERTCHVTSEATVEEVPDSVTERKTGTQYSMSVYRYKTWLVHVHCTYMYQPDIFCV